MKDYELLEKAAEYIERHGWHQRNLQGDDGSVCILGSLYGAADLLDFRTACSGLNRVLGPYNLLIECLETGSIPSWNDVPGRTEQEVLDALQKAAKLGRIREDCELSEGTS